jgi:hypothetical protein
MKGYLDETRCGYRQRTMSTGILWECTRQKHGPRKVFDAQGRVVREVPDHWYRRVKEDE